MQLKTIASDLVPVYESKTGEKLVNARELHEILMVGTRFNDWITRMIENYGFIEGDDFYSFLSKTPGRPSKEYLLIIDTAKEIAMVQNNEQGRAVRKYFIEVEKKARQTFQQPQSAAELILKQAELLVQYEKRINKLESQTAAAHHRIDNIDNIDTLGDPRQRLNKMIRLYAAKNGLSFPQAYRNFRQAFNMAYRTNLTLLIENYKMKHELSDLSIPEYLEKVNRLEDGIRVADKLLNPSTSSVSTEI